MKLVNQVVRLAKPYDALAISRMSRDLIECDLTWRWTSTRVRHAIADQNTNCVISTASGNLTGFSVAIFGETTAHLALLAVHPQFRRKGLGDYLVRWQELAAQTAGIQKVSLEVRANNTNAISFYYSLGYVDSGIIPNYYDNVEDAVRMIHLI